MADSKNKMLHKRSVEKGKVPSGSTLEYGEIAINYNAEAPFLSIKDSNNNYRKFIDETTIDEKLSDFLTTEITYSELVALRDDGELIPGMQYRITDYVTTTTQTDTQSAGHQFDVIVTADDESTLNEVARACCSDFDIEKYKDAYSGTLGENMSYIGIYQYEGKEYHLYESINTSDKVQMLVDFYRVNKVSEGGTIGYSYYIYPHYAKFSEAADWEDGYDFGEDICFKLNPIVNYFNDANLNSWKLWYCLDNDTERFNWADNKIIAYVDNYEGGSSVELIVKANPDDSAIVQDMKVLYIHEKEDGSELYITENMDVYDEGERFVGDCHSISFSGKGVIYRMIDEFGNDCPYDFKNIQFKRKLTDGVLDTENGVDTWCYTFNAYCTDNTTIYDASVIAQKEEIDDDANRCYGNIIKEYYNNVSNEGLILNDIVFLNIYTIEGATYFDCHSNSFGNNCYNNSFGNICESNSFGNDCSWNSFGGGCSWNSFGNDCSRNFFGNEFNFNSFGNNCHRNSFRISADTSSSLKSYVRYNHFDDGCSFNVIWNSGTTSSSVQLKNINVNRGVCGTSSSYNYININTLNSEQEINVNQVDGIVSIGNILSITYESLKTLRDSSKLIPGQQYRIIDYVTTTVQENTRSAGHPFDVIVTALNEYTLSEEAQAVQHIDNEGYFDDSNLSAWKLWYCLDNNTDRFAWAGDEKVSEIEHKFYDSSECTINSELIDGNEFITPFNFESCVWVDGDGDGDIAYEGGINHDEAELIYEWGYFTDENDNTHLCLYKSDAGLYEEEGQPDYGDKYLYRGVITVDGTDYDYWQKWDENYRSINNVGGTGDHVYATTPRIVSNPEAYSVIIETEEIYAYGKGVIYRMIDEFNNDCPYDFKNIQFIRYELNAPETVDTEPWMAQLSTNIQAQFSNNELPYVWGGFEHGKNRSWENINQEIYSIPTGNQKAFYTFSTVIDDIVTDHSLIQGCCYDNIMKEYIISKKQTLNNNIFLNTWKSNYCYNNSFEGNCYNNSFGNECSFNSFGHSCHHNSFGHNCFSNSFESNCFSNSFGHSYESNSFGRGCFSNSFGYDCYSNSFGVNCESNSFGRGCYHNSFGNSCSFNSFGSECYWNTFGVNCESNSFGYGCCSNSFGNECKSNSFGNVCYSNSFGNECYWNTFRVSADTSSSLKSYVHYNHFDDGCSFNVIWNSGTTSSSVPLKNININRGVAGTSSSYNMINIDTLNQDYEIQVAKNSKGEIKIYCEADLIL